MTSSYSFKEKPVNSWSNKDCLDWIDSIKPTITSKLFITLHDDIKDNDTDGEGLLNICASTQSVCEQVRELMPNVEESDALIVHTALNKFQQLPLPCNNQKDSGCFTVFVIHGNKTLKIQNMRSQSTVGDLVAAISDMLAIKNFTLHCGTDVLNENETLDKYNISNESLVYIVFKVVGGTTLAKKRKHTNFKKYPEIKRTEKPDCLFGYTLREGFSVVEMPCGHCMEAQSMYEYMQSKMAKDLRTKIIINCPLPKCNTIWDFKLCCRVAGLSEEEYIKINRIKDIRGRDDVRECPHPKCKAFCKRKSGVAILRVNCGKCHGTDWCWVCGQIWKGSSLMVCNNSNCPLVSSLNEKLSTCGEEIPFGWANVNPPSGKTKFLPNIRACPSCLQLTNKPTGCKHMTCNGCMKKYCFACLKDQKDCLNSKYTKYCEVAPIQQFI